jgi:hypothetical protein
MPPPRLRGRFVRTKENHLNMPRTPSGVCEFHKYELAFILLRRHCQLTMDELPKNNGLDLVA